MRIAVVEDDRQEQKRLETYISQWSQETGIETDVTLFGDGDEILEPYTARWDLIFLDIQMPHLDGMTAAGKIRELDRDVILVFITNMGQYAIKGYSVQAMDFLLKPVHRLMVSQVLQQAQSRIGEKGGQYLALPVENGMYRLNLADIWYVEVNDHMLSIVTEKQTYQVRKSMSELEKQLVPHHFFRCGSGYLINLAQVKQISKNMVTVGKKQVPVSRSKQKQFMAAMTDYFGGEML